ncbi:hypothetical protein L7F22_057204 [Adiantum nelumboides]|nr:hypothetical protein [Adiantum nelumboides]
MLWTSVATTRKQTPFHKDDAMSTQEVVEHESDFVAQKPSNDMNKGSDNMLPTIGETQIHEGNTRNSEEKMVVVENQSDVQTSPKPSDDMIIKDTYNMPLRDEEVEGSEKKDEANEEHQGALATMKVQDKVDKGTGKATRNANKAQSIKGRVQGTEGGKRVLRYIAGTLDYDITYTRGGDSTLVRFCGSDWARDIDGRRSVTGYCFSLGSGVISWISKKQPTVALSSTEAEYKAVCFASCEALWLRRHLGDMGAVQEQPTMLLCDNQSCMAIARNPVFHVRTKHIEVQYHFVRELILDGEVEMEYCPTMDNCADIFTKALGSKTLERHLHQIGVGPKQ